MKIERAPRAYTAFEHLRIAAAAERLKGVVKRTPLLPFDSGDQRIEAAAGGGITI